MNKQIQPLNPIKMWLSLVVRMSLFAVALMWPAGTWHWRDAWVLVGLWTIYGIVMMLYLLRYDPALLAERLKLVPLHKEQKAWDKVIMLLFFIAGIGLYIVPGFDVVRYEWSEPLPVWMRILAMLIHLPCFVLLGWIMRENTYLSQVVKIYEERGQGNHHRTLCTGTSPHVHSCHYFVVCCACCAWFKVCIDSCRVSDVTLDCAHLF